jgi:hypothetical protein
MHLLQVHASAGNRFPPHLHHEAAQAAILESLDDVLPVGLLTYVGFRGAQAAHVLPHATSMQHQEGHVRESSLAHFHGAKEATTSLDMFRISAGLP